MADQGLLAQSKPAATTNTVLYSAPIDASASTMLNIMNDGTGAAYDVAIKDYDQKLTLDASTYKLHPGDVITSYKFTINTAIAAGAITAGQKLESDDKEASLKFESFSIPTYTEIFVKKFAIRQITVESVTGTFAVGETVVKGSGGNTATATVYSVNTAGTIIHVGPTVLAGSGAEFAAGDALTASGGATATIASGGIGTANNEFAFSTTTAGGTYNLYLGDGNTGLSDLVNFSDRTYRFNVADASMSGLIFRLSTTINGEYGPDNDAAATADNGTEFTTGKTTSGTAGSGGAYIQYDFGSNAGTPATLYIYDGNTGSNAGAGYGGSDRFITVSGTFTYVDFYAYDVEGTWTNSTDGFTLSGTTYTVTAQTAGPYGYVRKYDGTALFVIKGTNSADFAAGTFLDNPKLSTASRTTATINSVAVATAAVEVGNYLVKDVSNGNNEIDKITSLVIGPGERLIVESATQNNVFSLIGFEDASTAFPTRVFGAA